MMGEQKSEPELFNYAVNLEKRVRSDHPLRRVAALIDFKFVREEVAHCYGSKGNVSIDTGVSTTYSPNNLNQYSQVGSGAVGNNNEHQVGTYQTISYSYINDERLSAVSSASNTYALAYDALGRCVSRTINGVANYYIYDGEKPILEYGSNGGLVGWNLCGKSIDELIERGAFGTNGTWYWYYIQDDHEGTVTHLTNSAGVVLEKYKYDVFGAPTMYDGSGNVLTATAYNNRFMFTGREYRSTFGIYEYRARAYHPNLGRFMGEDPKGFDAGDNNFFRYCHNDPEDLTDPMGLIPVDVDSDTEGYVQRGVKALVEHPVSYPTLAERILNWPERPEQMISVLQRDGSSDKKLSDFYRDNTRSVAVRAVQGGWTGLVDIHTHPNDNQDYNTGSHLSAADVGVAIYTGRTQVVLLPNGGEDRYRPSKAKTWEDREITQGKFEELKGGSWQPIKGAHLPDELHKTLKTWASDPKQARVNAAQAISSQSANIEPRSLSGLSGLVSDALTGVGAGGGLGARGGPP